MNSLVDPRMIQLLYAASQAGVKLDLIVRGICCLRPGIKGVSDNIRVISIVGRYLEHSRVYYFHNQREEELYLGSADLMPRNLDHCVEVLFPVASETYVRYLRDKVLEAYLRDNVRAHFLNADSTYTRATPNGNERPFDVQSYLMSGYGNHRAPV